MFYCHIPDFGYFQFLNEALCKFFIFHLSDFDPLDLITLVVVHDTAVKVGK